MATGVISGTSAAPARFRVCIARYHFYESLGIIGTLFVFEDVGMTNKRASVVAICTLLLVGTSIVDGGRMIRIRMQLPAMHV